MSEIFTIGCHLSTSKGFLNMGKEIVSIGGNTFQFFTRNPREVLQSQLMWMIWRLSGNLQLKMELR